MQTCSGTNIAAEVQSPKTKSRQALRAAAKATVRPNLLSEHAVAAIAHKMLGTAVEGDVCARVRCCSS